MPAIQVDAVMPSKLLVVTCQDDFVFSWHVHADPVVFVGLGGMDFRCQTRLLRR
jgi:hypothetical protein